MGCAMSRGEYNVGCTRMAGRCPGSAVSIAGTIYCIRRRAVAGRSSMSWWGSMTWR